MGFKYLQIASIFVLYINVFCYAGVSNNAIDEVNFILSNEGWWKSDKCVAIVDDAHVNASDLYDVGLEKRSSKLNQGNFNLMVRCIISILNCTFSEAIMETSVWFYLILKRGLAISEKNSYIYAEIVRTVTNLMFKIRRLLIRMQQAMQTMSNFSIHSSFPSQLILESMSKYLETFETPQEVSLRNIKEKMEHFALESQSSMLKLCIPSNEVKKYLDDFSNCIDENMDQTPDYKFSKVCGEFDKLLENKLYECCTSRGFEEIKSQALSPTQPAPPALPTPPTHPTSALNPVAAPYVAPPIRPMAPVQHIPTYSVPVPRAQAQNYRMPAASPQGSRGPMPLFRGPAVPPTKRQASVGAFIPKPR